MDRVTRPDCAHHLADEQSEAPGDILLQRVRDREMVVKIFERRLVPRRPFRVHRTETGERQHLKPVACHRLLALAQGERNHVVAAFDGVGQQGELPQIAVGPIHPEVVAPIILAQRPLIGE